MWRCMVTGSGGVNPEGCGRFLADHAPPISWSRMTSEAGSSRSAHDCGGRIAVREANMRDRPGKSEPRNRSTRPFAAKGSRRPPHVYRKAERDADAPGVLYGWHTVAPPRRNPPRGTRRLWATENAVRRLAEEGIAAAQQAELVRPDAIAARLPADAVHQGLLAEADPLPAPDIDALEDGVVL